MNSKTNSNFGVSRLKPILTSQIATSNELVFLSTDKREYSKREYVKINLKPQIKTAFKGDYSISVRKIDGLETISPTTSEMFVSLNSNDKEFINKLNKDPFILPELRGELIFGSIQANDALTSVKNKKVLISILGKDYFFRTVTTDELGKFHFSLDAIYEEENAYVQVLENSKNYTIQLNKQTPLLYKDIVFNKFRITPEMKDLIIERSIYNQINNAYFSLKPDTLKIVKPKTPFFGTRVEVYNLDEYTRFPTIKETLIELVPFVSLKKDKNNKMSFYVKCDNISIDSNYPVLVLVDGFPVLNQNVFTAYKSNKIKAIHVVRKQYYVGAKIFNGIIQIETIDGDYYKKVLNSSSVSVLPLFKPLSEKYYFHQRYIDSTKKVTNHIPDYRYQLLWEPQLKLEDEFSNISFFTSDITGEFEIRLEGFSTDGTPISIKEIITIE
jgi:cobalamin biosynthesis Co2+ chelatase CbiK